VIVDELYEWVGWFECVYLVLINGFAKCVGGFELNIIMVGYDFEFFLVFDVCVL